MATRRRVRRDTIFGGIINATFVDSSAVYTVAGPSIVPGGANVSATRRSTLFGLSKTALNGTLYYEDDRFSARVSASYRGPYVDANSGTGNVFEGYNEAVNVDASIRYKITPNIELSVEGVNLTDEHQDQFTDSRLNLPVVYHHTGREVLFGIRYTY